MVAVKKNAQIKIFSHLDDLFQMAAEDFIQRAMDAIRKKNLFTVVLSGGNTPKFLFDALTSSEFSKRIPWDRIQFFFTDERYVSANDVESNYHMAYEYLFAKVPVPAENIYRIPTELNDPKFSAQNYELTLRKVFGISNYEFPKFDLVYLGLGEDGHTASLMPFTELVETYCDLNINLQNKYQLVASLWAPRFNMYRITLTPPAINNAAGIIFLVTGLTKEFAVSSVLEGPFEPQRYPAQLIVCADGENIWYLDQAAAKKLTTLSF